MAKKKTLLDRFRSLKRPSLTPSGGGFSSMAKKNASAEDLLIDNMYADGDISISAYLSHLRLRLNRSWNTPRQEVSISKKMETANEAIIDAEVARAHDAGEISTKVRYEYENEKLSRMLEPGSTAHIKQQQLVQSLKDRSEKEERSQFRIDQLNKISQMPEDTSDKLWQKASIYDTLAQQARLDGDEQQAISLETQKNNYTASAKRAEINDFITETRLAVSKTPTLGRGVPSSEEGAKVISGLTGEKISTPAPGEAAGEGTGLTGFTGVPGGTSSAVSSALKRLDRQQKTLERLYGQREDKALMIEAYQQAVAASSGDQQTQLTIALNNLEDGLEGLDNSIANTTSNVEDTITKVREAQQKAAAAAFNQERRTVEKELSRSEDGLETAFKDGEISKHEYVAKGIMLAETKAMFFDQVSMAYNEFGNDSSADNYLEKAEDMISIHESLINVGQNIDDYEPLFTDSESPLTNLLGEKTSKGDVILSDVRNLKQSGRFGDNYALLDGIYHKVYYPPEFSDTDGFLRTDVSNKELAKIRDNAFINKMDDNGLMITENVNFVQFQDENGKAITQPVPESRVNKLLEIGSIIRDEKKGLIQAPPEKGQSILSKAGVATQKFLEKNVPGFKDMRESFEKTTGEYGDRTPLEKILDPIGANKLIEERLPGVIKNVTDFGKRVFESVKDFFGGAKDVGEDIGNFFTQARDRLSDTISDFQFPSIIRPAIAADDDKLVAGTPAEYHEDIINASKKHGIPSDVLSSLLKQESNFNPDAISSAGAIGIAQIMPETAKDLGIDPRDPSQAIDGAARYLKQQLDEFGNMDEALAAYNAGAGSVKKYGGIPPFEETRNYVKRVIGNLGRTISSFFGGGQEVRDYTDEEIPDPKRTRNIELALGLSPGQYRKGLKQDQAAVDRAFRSNDPAMIKLLEEEGFSQTLAPVQPGRTVGFPKRTQTTVPPSAQRPSQVQNLFDLFKPKLISPLPEAPRPTFTQLASNTFRDIRKAAQPALTNIREQFRPGSPSIFEQIKALPRFGREVVVPKIKSFFSNLFK